MVAGAGRIGARGAAASVADIGTAGRFASTGGSAESGSNAIATSAASANAEVSACLSSLASELSRASTSPGDCSFVPSLQPTATRAAIASVAKRRRLIIRQPIRLESIGWCCDSCAAVSRRVAS